MNPVQHPSNNLKLTPPKDWNQDELECITITATQIKTDDGRTQIATFWKPTKEQLAVLNQNGNVIVAVIAETFAPMIVGVGPDEATERG